MALLPSIIRTETGEREDLGSYSKMALKQFIIGPASSVRTGTISALATTDPQHPPTLWLLNKYMLTNKHVGADMYLLTLFSLLMMTY